MNIHFFPGWHDSCSSIPQQGDEKCPNILGGGEMPLLAWKEEYSVDIREIDEQHKNLVAMINMLNEAMRQGQGKLVLESILNKLINYTATHFAAEERLLQAHGFPGLEEHRGKHEKMTRKVLILRQDFIQGKLSISIEVMDFLMNWLDKHILGTDRNYSRFLLDRSAR
jgi:hemerythrin